MNRIEFTKYCIKEFNKKQGKNKSIKSLSQFEQFLINWLFNLSSAFNSLVAKTKEKSKDEKTIQI